MSNNPQNPFSFIAEYNGDEKSIYDIEFPETLPVLPLRDSVLFPGVILPISVGRAGSLKV